tara:strand:+ start:168 stop:383 length:216 start_codon:yes stop_codon:yes gene_type:complete
VKNVNAPNIPVTLGVNVDAKVAADLLKLMERLQQVVSDLDDSLTVRKPVGTKTAPSSRYIRKSPRLRARFR